jgi:hypothetical protein
VATVFLPSDLGTPDAAASEDGGKPGSDGLAGLPDEIPHKLDVSFENKVHLVGYKLDPPFAPPGQDVKLTFWWRCDEAIDDGWQLFTHLKDRGTGCAGGGSHPSPRELAASAQHRALRA